MTMSSLFSKTGLWEYVIRKAGNLAENVNDFLQITSDSISEHYVAAIASQASPRPALLVQNRTSKVISRVPKISLWVLVTANTLYILLAIMLSIYAWLATSTSTDVHQLRTRLSVTGIAAQLFEGPYAERRVKDDKELFEKPSRVNSEFKRVEVHRTAGGGTTFVVVKA